jgi:hypothetical protein
MDQTGRFATIPGVQLSALPWACGGRSAPTILWRTGRRLITAASYVALNPLRAQLVEWAEDWCSPSVVAHQVARDDALLNFAPLLDPSPAASPTPI